MKTNIIHTLIIAIILVAGWSLFAVFQDFMNSGTAYTQRSFLGKSKEYLPLLPDEDLGRKNYPVYRGSGRMTKNSYNKPGLKSNNLLSPESMSVGNGGGDIAYADNGRATESADKMNSYSPAYTGRERAAANAGVERQSLKATPISAPFSKSLKPEEVKITGDVGNASGSVAETSMLSGGNSGMQKVFGGDQEGDDLEGGGGIENEDYYNDMPVGDGLWLLLLMAAFYAALKILRKRSGAHHVALKK